MQIKLLARLIACSAQGAQGRVSGASVGDNRAVCDFVHTVNGLSVSDQCTDAKHFSPAIPANFGTVRLIPQAASFRRDGALFILDFYANALGRGISFEPALINQR